MAKKQPRPAEAWRYVLQDDRALPAEQQSVFVLRPLTQGERLDVHDNLTRQHRAPDGSRATVTRTHRLTLELALQNIVSVENFPVGAPEPWPDDYEARVRYLEALDDRYVQELGNEIYAHSTIGPDVKNS